MPLRAALGTAPYARRAEIRQGSPPPSSARGSPCSRATTMRAVPSARRGRRSSARWACVFRGRACVRHAEPRWPGAAETGWGGSGAGSHARELASLHCRASNSGQARVVSPVVSPALDEHRLILRYGRTLDAATAEFATTSWRTSRVRRPEVPRAALRPRARTTSSHPSIRLLRASWNCPHRAARSPPRGIRTAGSVQASSPRMPPRTPCDRWSRVVVAARDHFTCS